MHIGKVVPDLIFLTHEESDWIYPLDYEHVPFRCSKFHGPNHMCRDFPLNKVHTKNMKEEEKYVECFQKTGKKRCNTNKLTLEKEKEDCPTTGNSFVVLEGQPEIRSTNQAWGIIAKIYYIQSLKRSNNKRRPMITHRKSFAPQIL